jgi:outer membrane protein TolC
MRLTHILSIPLAIPLILSLLLPMTLSAEPLTLPQAVQEAIRNSPQLQKVRSSRDETSWKRVESYAGFLPSISASANYLTDKKYLLTDVQIPPATATLSIPAIVPTSNFVVTAQYPLFEGFASLNRYHSAKAFESSANNEFDWAKFQLERQMTLQYFKAVAAQALENVAKQNIAALEDHLKDVRLFKRAGVSTNYDVLRVEVQVSEAKAELLNSSDNTAINRSKLAELMGHENETRDLPGSLPVLSTDLIEHLDSQNVPKRKDLASFVDRAKGFEYLESAAAAYWVPRLSFFGQYQYYNNINDNISDRDVYREAYQVGISLTWNIFDGAVSMAKSKESIEQKYQAEKSLRIAQLKAQQDLDLWKRKFLYFSTVYRSRVGDVEKSTESVRLAREGRKVGSRTNSDLLDAESELYRARAGVINAQVGAIEALINLELATGQELYRF